MGEPDHNILAIRLTDKTIDGFGRQATFRTENAMIFLAPAFPEPSLPERELQIACFEAIFRIPPIHALKLRFHSRGDMRPERWVHVEYDDQGQFVARYASDALADDPTCRIDWKKFDTGGLLIASGNDRLQQC
jgi:hypothetical protein